MVIFKSNMNRRFFSPSWGKPDNGRKEYRSFLCNEGICFNGNSKEEPYRWTTLVFQPPKLKKDNQIQVLFGFELQKAMASGGHKSVAFTLLVLNLLLYFLVIVIASWAVNHGIKRSRETASVLSLPARIFPIYCPMGNMATGVFIIFALIAGVVGFTTSVTGLHNIFQWNAPSLHTAATSSLTTWALTLLAMGFACKEIELGWTDSNLRTLETTTIIVTATQLLYTGVIHVGVSEVLPQRSGRV